MSATWDNQQSGGALFAAAPAMVNTCVGGADMAQSTCSVPSCDRLTHVRGGRAAGLCWPHAARLYRSGDVRADVPIHVPAAGCAVEGCHRPHAARGYCPTHLQRLKVHGDVRADVPVFDYSRSPEQRLHDLTDRRGTDECWPWLGAKLRGWGHFTRHGNTNTTAHRFAYEVAYGPVPAGMEVDHVCHSRSDCQMGEACPHRACVNPAHLEAVTSKENSRRSRHRLS